MASYLVTGGCGFIGSNISEELVKRGHRVRIIDNLSSGKIENIESFKDKVEFINGDITDRDTVKEAVEGMEYILHQAAISSVQASINDPIGSNTNNICGTLNILVCAKDMGIKRVVIAGSSAAYGDTPELPKTEEMGVLPKSPYAVTKYAGELYGKVFHEIYGLETVSLRYFNVFGPKQDPNSPYGAVIPKFLNNMLKGKSPFISGDGLQSRDFTYIDNVVEANVKAVVSESVGHGEVINIGCGESYSLLQVVEYINHILGTNINPLFEDAKDGDIKESLADITKAKELLGYNANIKFHEGLKRYIEWYKRF